MSALGQKQTCAVPNVMSAFPPKADMCGATRDVRFAYSVRPKQQERSPILICVKRILKSPCLAIGLGTTWLGGANVRFLSSNKILRGDYAGGGDYADRHSVAVRCSDRRSTFSYR